MTCLYWPFCYHLIALWLACIDHPVIMWLSCESLINYEWGLSHNTDCESGHSCLLLLVCLALGAPFLMPCPLKSSAHVGCALPSVFQSTCMATLACDTQAMYLLPSPWLSPTFAEVRCCFICSDIEAGADFQDIASGQQTVSLKAPWLSPTFADVALLFHLQWHWSWGRLSRPAGGHDHAQPAVGAAPESGTWCIYII